MKQLDSMAKAPAPAPSRSSAGFTLVEMVVSLLVAAMLSAGLIRCVVVTKALNNANEQRVIAYGMAKSMVEEMQSLNYEDVVPDRFPAEEEIPLTHLGGEHHVALDCRRETNIATFDTPDRKRVQVDVQWSYRGRDFSERAVAVVYPK